MSHSSRSAETHTLSGTEETEIRRACDQCRIRKIRCDKDQPCSNCRTAHRTCTSTGIGQRAKEPRQRVLISSQYERKIDQIEARLANIETLLRDLSTRDSLPDGNRSAYTPQSFHESSNPGTFSTAEFDASDDESLFADEPILAAQKDFANEFLEKAVQRTSLTDLHPAMQEALTNLRQLKEMQSTRSSQTQVRFPLKRPIPPGGLSELAMPPIDIVSSMLKYLRNAPPCYFTIICQYIHIQDFSSLCRVVYFPSNDFSDAVFTIVNVCLYYMFFEQHALATDLVEKQKFESYFQMCRVNLETSLANLSLFMSAKIDNVRALLLGVMYATDTSKPAVAWTLNSTAAQLCQTAGFHRIIPTASDKPAILTKRALFWQVYNMDKALSLRLGRAAVIQDWDITIPREHDFNHVLGSEAAAVPGEWLKLAALQGQIYEHLYSTSAIAQPQSELIEKARSLADQCRRTEREASETRKKAIGALQKMKASPVVNIHVKGDEVQVLATLTLVYRAIPAPDGSPSRFCDECIETARKAMRKHQECVQSFENQPFVLMIYIHWNLLLLPFAPFFVLFCYVIETSSHEDLRLLYEFTSTLSPARFASETAEKLWRLCSVMYSIAALYVEAKSKQQEDQAMIPIGDEFDMYLNQLGFMPMEDQPMLTQAASENGEFMTDNLQAVQMFDWFSGSRNLMGLLDQDLSQFSSQSWSVPGPNVEFPRPGID